MRGESASAAHRALVLMAKEPEPGVTKTRLARDLGEAAADTLYRAFLADLSVELASFSWTCRVARAGDGPAPVLSSRFGPPWTLAPQGEGSLGQRLCRCAVESFAAGAHAVVLCGSDAPTLTAADVSAAFDALGAADLVLAPSPDGGYSLIGLSRGRREPGALAGELFAEVRWSTPQARSDTLAAAGRIGLRTRLLREIPDVDVAEDLAALERELAERPAVAPFTRRALETLRAQALLGKAPRPGQDA